MRCVTRPLSSHIVVRLGPGQAPVSSHVYVAGAPTMTCSEIEPTGELANLRGFDISDHSVVVFRYGSMHDRHDIKTDP